MSAWKNDKVQLKGLSTHHYEVVERWNFSPELTDFFPPRFPSGSLEQDRWFKRQLESTDKKMLIIETPDDIPVGILSFMKIDHINKNCEVGITIGESSYHGSGIAGCALNLGLAYMFNQQNMHIVYARVLSNNERAIRFFGKMKFQLDGIHREMIFMDSRYLSWMLMSISRSEFSSFE